MKTLSSPTPITLLPNTQRNSNKVASTKYSSMQHKWLQRIKKKNRKTPKSTLKRLTQNVSESQNIGAKTIKLSEENILENLCGLGFGTKNKSINR